MKKTTATTMSCPFWAAMILLTASASAWAQPDNTPPPSPPAAAPTGAKEIVWEKTFEAALEKAKAEDKLIMVDFHADWCRPCQVMDEKTFADKAVIAELSRFVNVKVDVEVEAREDVAGKYANGALPFVAFVRADGTMLRGEEGVVPPGEFAAILRVVYQRWEQEQAER